MYRRVLVKLSGEALAGTKGFGIEPSVVDRLTDEVKQVHETGVSLGLVIGGGNIVRGSLASQKGMDRVQADYMGMLATIINALAIQDLLERKEVATRVHFYEVYKDQAAYFSTDTAAALRAIEMDSEVIIKATKVKGIYTADPHQDSKASFIPKITFEEVVRLGLQVMDTAAVSLCKENSLPIIVLNIEDKGSVSSAIKGDQVGTLVS